MDNLVIFCKTYDKDFDRFKILKTSIDKFNVDKIPFYIICPDRDVELFKSLIIGNENYKISIITDEEVLNANGLNNSVQSWHNQQLIKLGFYKLNLCKFYAIFDSDCYFIQDFKISDFMYDESTPYLRVRVEECEVLKPIKEFFNRRGCIYSFIFMGQVFSCKVLQDMEKEVLVPNNYTLESLITICPYEFNWYGEYFISKKQFYNLKGECLKAFWIQGHYNEAQKSGLTTEDFIKQGYLGFVIQNGWVKESVYKPSKIYKLIKLKNNWSYIWHSREVQRKSNIFGKIHKFFKLLRKNTA